MKLTSKALIISGLISIPFFVCAILAANHNISLNSIYIISLTIILSIVTFLSIYTAIVKRVKRLNQDSSDIISTLSLPLHSIISRRIDMNGNDEVHSIASKINILLDNMQSSQQLFNRQLKERTQALENTNLLLKQDISARVRIEKVANDNENISQLVKYDNLTTLPNGVFFNEILNKAINHSRRHKQILAILLIDIDSFQPIRDLLDHNNCELILKEMGKRFTNVLRNEDVLAKLDGEEFIVLLNDISKPKFASMVAEKLLNICSQLIKVDTHEFSLTASIGICIYPNDGASMENLLENADRALFKVRQAGGRSYQFHTEEMHIEALEYIQLESALRKAIHNNEIALYYQPKFRIKTGNITGVEGLMRWEHPVLGIVSPAKFIPLAEESGLILQLGEWALDEAAKKIKYWQDEGYEHITIALKLSPKQFHHPDITKILNKVLQKNAINPQYIEFEITERTVMENVELASMILDNIKATGVQLSIDHFGIGYTSISYLKQLPINAIKIDRSFIKGIPNNPNDCAITSAVIALAHNLGLEVVSEGVETAEQIQFLANQQCDVVQGYFLSHPVSAQKLLLQFKKLRDEVLI